MLKQSKSSNRSKAASVFNRRATRADSSAFSSRRPLRNLSGGRSSSATPQRAGLEVELKLGVTNKDLDILKDHPLFSNRESSRNEELVSIYLDAKDRALRRQGLSLRLRRKGEELLQTTKGAYQGFLDRSEHETSFIRDERNHPGAVGAFLRNLDRTALKPIFKTKIQREIYQIGGIEVCLDKGEIIAGRRSSPIAEVELD
jgi:inorganic triphosphatase YgiF